MIISYSIISLQKRRWSAFEHHTARAAPTVLHHAGEYEAAEKRDESHITVKDHPAENRETDMYDVLHSKYSEYSQHIALPAEPELISREISSDNDIVASTVTRPIHSTTNDAPLPSQSTASARCKASSVLVTVRTLA